MPATSSSSILSCELNWIEHYWRSCKHFAGEHYSYTLAGKLRLGVKIRPGAGCWFLSLAAGLREAALQALESVKGSYPAHGTFN